MYQHLLHVLQMGLEASLVTFGIGLGAALAMRLGLWILNK